MWARLGSIALGIWLMASPSSLGYEGRAAVNDWIIGPLAVAFAVIAIREVARPLRRVNGLLGAWLLLAPWVLVFGWSATLNSTAVGLLMIAFASVPGHRFAKVGGGWSALIGPGDAWLQKRKGDENDQAAPSRPRVVVITGASAGVGRATALEFARQGAKIGLLARGRAGLEAARAEVEQLGGQALAVPTDVADAQAVEAAAEAVERAFGPIDIWINCAMLSVFSPIKEMKAEEYRRVTEVTYLGNVHGCLAALKRMLPRDQGVIIQVGSALAYRGIPLQSAYCGSKHAIQGLTDSLRAELYHDGSRVRVTSVHMPGLNTPQFRWVRSRLPHKGQPVPPIFQPEVAARAILFAADHNRREILVGFPTMKAVWGNQFFPGYGDRYLGRTGYQGQQTDEPRDPNRPDNLWEPLDEAEDHGAHGVFDDRATESCPGLWFEEHRGRAGRTAAAVLAAACWITLALVQAT